MLAFFLLGLTQGVEVLEVKVKVSLSWTETVLAASQALVYLKYI